MEESLAQIERVRKHIGGTRPEIAGNDRGFRGKKEVNGAQILISKNRKERSRYKQEVAEIDLESEQQLNPQYHM